MINSSGKFIDKKSFFFVALLTICLSYFLFEYVFISFEIISADEFVFARHIYEYTYHLPYRDFAPYKTVLGYYLFSLPMYFSHAIWQPLLYIKDEIALLNTLFIFLAAYLAIPLFDKKAILFTILALLANQQFLVYSIDLRVDMLTSWCCLFAILCFLSQRVKLSGLLLGLAFLISQKALWYIVAMNASLLICVMIFRTSLFTWRSICLLNATCVLPIVVYIAIWSFIASPAIVYNSLFYEAYIQAGINFYMPIYMRCWQTILYFGPLLFLLWPLTIVCCLQTSSDSPALAQRLFIFNIASIALFLLINYKQAFPYNMVFTMPAFFLLYAEFMTWLFNSANKVEKTHGKLFLSTIVIYTIFLAILINFSKTINVYLLILFIPTCLFIYLTPTVIKRTKNFIYNALLALLISLGIIYPLYQSIKQTQLLSGHYQQKMLLIAKQILINNEGYVGGIPYFYNTDQAIPGLKNLIGPALEYLNFNAQQLKPLLLPSLYSSSVNTQEIVAALQQTSIKLYLSNYRMFLLPQPIKEYLANNFQHFYGSIYIYSPIITAKQKDFKLVFENKYRIVTKNEKIRIDGKFRDNQQIIYLTAGKHTTKAKNNYRLVLVPEVDKHLLTQDDESNQWALMSRNILN